jgi:hypothetical protein
MKGRRNLRSRSAQCWRTRYQGSVACITFTASRPQHAMLRLGLRQFLIRDSHALFFRLVGLEPALSPLLSLPSSPSAPLNPFIFRFCSFTRSCFATCTRPRKSPMSSTPGFLHFLSGPLSTSCFFGFWSAHCPLPELRVCGFMSSQAQV